MRKTGLLIIMIFLLISCGLSEDCFKGNGNKITKEFEIKDFTKIKPYSGIGVVLKEGSEYKVILETSDNIIDEIEISKQGDMLVMKDNSTCNLARDYGMTKVYITSPNITEIHSKTEQNIESDGILHFPELNIYSVDLTDGAGTGDFYLGLESDNVYIESNNVSNFYLTGTTINLNVFFSWGNGKFNGSNLRALNSAYVHHRGTNEITVNVITKITGGLYSSGNLRIVRLPIEPLGVIQYFTGHLIYP